MAARRRTSALSVLVLALSVVGTSAAYAAEFDVAIEDFAYVPEDLDVAVGDTVTWTNLDAEPHTVTSLPTATEQFDAELQQGESFSYTFTEDGYNPYWCTFHPEMQGDVVVGDAERPDPLDLSPIEADDATGASIAYSQRAMPEGSAGGAALVGRDDLFADALASGGVQGALGAPLLLTAGAELDPRVAEELARLAVETVWLMGGENAVSAEVAEALEAEGYTVDRLDGATRIETAVDAAMTALPDATTAIVARAYAAGGDESQAFADSLSAGALAAVTGSPVLLSETEALSAPTAAYLEGSAVETVWVVGGEAALSEQVVTDLQALDLEVERLGGANRVETAAMVANTHVFTAGPLGEAVVLIDGQSDLAWAAGFPAAVLELPVLLADGEQLPQTAAAFMLQIGSYGMPPLCGPFLAEQACADASAAATSVAFGEEGFLLSGLEGRNVVDDSGTAGQGDPDVTATASVYATDRADTLCYDVSADPPVDFTEAAVHAGAEGETGEVVLAFDLAVGPFGYPSGCAFDLEPETVEALLADPRSYYVQLANDAYPEGVLRGQLFSPTFIVGAELTPDAEVPGPGDPGEEVFGFGDVVGVSDTEICAHIFLSELSSPVTAAHIHQAPEGEAGPVVLPLRTPVAPGDTYACYTAEAALVEALETNPEDYYINVHTEALPDGAVRGQLMSF